LITGRPFELLRQPYGLIGRPFEIKRQPYGLAGRPFEPKKIISKVKADKSLKLTQCSR